MLFYRCTNKIIEESKVKVHFGFGAWKSGLSVMLNE